MNMKIVAAAVALCALLAPVTAHAFCCCPYGSTDPECATAYSTHHLVTDWCGNPGQEKCIPVVNGKCPGNMDPGGDGACSTDVDGPEDAAVAKKWLHRHGYK